MRSRSMKMKVLWGSVVVLTPVLIYAANLTIPNTFSAGTPISSAQMNANFTAVQTAVNSKQDATVVTCPANQAVTSIAANGTTTCAPFASNGIPTLNLQANAMASCSAILSGGASLGDGLYWINPSGGATTNAFRAYCDMTTQAGGWTLVMNVEPADGSFVNYTNTSFWIAQAEYGQIPNHFTHDYKGPAAWLLAGTNVMVQVANPGPQGNIIGWKAWTMSAQSFGVFFNSAPNTVQTTGVIGSSVTGVYAYEPLIKNGTQLRSNIDDNTAPNLNNDLVRLGTDQLPTQDDNMPGLGTQMNSSSCGTTNPNCYRYRDVELVLTGATNLWCTAPNGVTPAGTISGLGRDQGCGSSCGNCIQIQGAADSFSPYWTYRIYVR